MRKFVVLMALLVGVSWFDYGEAARATGPMTLTGFICAKASEGTKCLGDYPAGGGAWDGPENAVALEVNDQAFVFLTGGLAIYKYATGSISDDASNTPPLTVAASGGGGWNLQAINPSSMTIPKTSGTAGTTCVYEANSTDTSQVCWQGPDNRSTDLKLKFPDADPATSVLVCGAPSTTVSTCVWYAMDADLSSVSASDDTIPSAKAVKAVTDARLSTTAPTAIDGSSGTGPTAAQMADPRCHVSNYGQAASDVAVALPTVAENLSCLFTVGTAQTNKWGVRAATNDKIYLIAADGTISAGSDNGYARMTNAQVGQSFACWSFKTGSSAFDWQCKAIAIGTSTFAAN